MVGKKIHVLLTKDPRNLTGVCRHCGPVDLKMHHGDKLSCAIGYAEQRSKEVRKHYRSYYKVNPDGSKEISLTLYRDDVYERMKSAVCETCGSHDDLVVDHCHTHGHYRGILCRGCNTTLGRVKDNAELLRRLADYLDRTGPVPA